LSCKTASGIIHIVLAVITLPEAVAAEQYGLSKTTFGANKKATNEQELKTERSCVDYHEDTHSCDCCRQINRTSYPIQRGKTIRALEKQE
jgi:hypothetical protein